jgi:hypothetical protein
MAIAPLRTSGRTLEARRPARAPQPGPRRAEAAEPPLVRSIVVLYVGLALTVTVIMTLAFVIPYLVV